MGGTGGIPGTAGRILEEQGESWGGLPVQYSKKWQAYWGDTINAPASLLEISKGTEERCQRGRRRQSQSTVLEGELK